MAVLAPEPAAKCPSAARRATPPRRTSSVRASCGAVCGSPLRRLLPAGGAAAARAGAALPPAASAALLPAAEVVAAAAAAAAAARLDDARDGCGCGCGGGVWDAALVPRVLTDTAAAGSAAAAARGGLGVPRGSRAY